MAQFLPSMDQEGDRAGGVTAKSTAFSNVFFAASLREWQRSLSNSECLQLHICLSVCLSFCLYVCLCVSMCMDCYNPLSRPPPGEFTVEYQTKVRAEERKRMIEAASQVNVKTPRLAPPWLILCVVYYFVCHVS